MKHLTIKKYIITIALAITSALFVVFGLCTPKNNPVVRAETGESSDYTLTVDDSLMMRPDWDYNNLEDLTLVPELGFYLGLHYADLIATESGEYRLYGIQTEDFSYYLNNFSYTKTNASTPNVEIQGNFNFFASGAADNTALAGGNASYIFEDSPTTVVDSDKEYYYFLLIVKRTVQKTSGKYTVKYTEVAKSSNYLQTSYSKAAEKYLRTDRYVAKMKLTNSQTVRSLRAYMACAGYSTENNNVNVVLRYKTTVNKNTDEIETVNEVYQIENLKSLNETYVYDSIMNLSKKSSLSDFNVVRQEVGYTVNGNSDSAFLQDEYTLLEANGYGYTFNKETNQGEFTVTYGNFAAKDFALTVRSNDDLHSVLFIRSGDIKTAGGTTTITFDTSNIKTRLSNNFNWNVDNTDFNNYVFYNPHGSGVTFKKNLTGTDVTSITITTADTNLLADCSLRLEIQVVPPVELTVTVKYLHLSYENGEITEEWKTYPLTEKIWSTPNYTKINKTAFYDGDSDIGISAQGDFIEENLSITDSNGNRIERAVYDGVTLGTADNGSKTAMITVKYIRNPLFRVHDSVTDDYYFVKAYRTSLNYSGSDFIVEHDGYRVKSIQSVKTEYARIDWQGNVYDWNNAKVYIVNIGSAEFGNIIPLEITYSDKWQVNVEYLENYYKETDGKKKATGFAIKKTYGKEIGVKGSNGELAFADINHPTIDEVVRFLGKSSADDLTVVTFGKVDKNKIEVTFASDVFTIKLSYGRANLSAIQVDGSYEYINVPLSNWNDWVSGFGKDWTILVLNTNANIAFDSEFDVDPNDLYGYFYVVMYKEQVKNLDGLFAGYTADGCRSFYSCKKVVGNSVYKTCESMGVLESILCLGINKIIQAGLETKYDDFGTYYSYFLFIDGSSMLAYAANNKADDYFDHDSAAKNTFENIGETISEWWQKGGAVVKFIKILLIVLAVLLIAAIVIKFLDFVWGVTDKHKRK